MGHLLSPYLVTQLVVVVVVAAAELTHRQFSSRKLKMSLSLNRRGSAGGQVVIELVFYSDDPSSNPAEVYSSFYSVNCLKRKKINKRGRDGLFKKTLIDNIR